MKTKYIFRMDDITPDMHWENFYKYINLFKKYGIKPLIGIVPDNQDPVLMMQPKNSNFWGIIRDLQENNIIDIAQHGSTHVYVTKRTKVIDKIKDYLIYGYLPPSEFVGLSYEEQAEKIKKGLDILEQNGVKSDIWMAPSNSFDRITLRALKNLGFKYVTYGIALFPYCQEGLQFIPQPLWGPEAISAGITTIALHTNWCDDKDLAKLENFIASGIETISFRDACKYSTSKAEHLLNALYMVYYILFRLKNALKRKLFKE